METGTESNTGELKLLRYTLISMLFALAISQVAIRTTSWIEIVSVSGWTLSPAIPALIQLILALFVITMSWFGWAVTTIKSHESFEELASVGYLLVILDIFLVIGYFYLAESTEIDDKLSSFRAPSYQEESYGLIAIFLMYVLWDVLNSIRRHSKIWSVVITILPSVVTLILIGVLVGAAHLNSQASPYAVTVAVDIGLVLLVVFFRMIKWIRLPLEIRFGLPQASTGRSVYYRHLSGVLFIFYLSALATVVCC